MIGKKGEGGNKAVEVVNRGHQISSVRIIQWPRADLESVSFSYIG